MLWSDRLIKLWVCSCKWFDLSIQYEKINIRSMEVTVKYYRENGKGIELNQDSELASCSAQKVARCHDVL